MFHTVMITSSGYAAHSGHETFLQAALTARDVFKRTHWPVIVRDGQTGKRYCLRDAELMIPATIYRRQP